MDSRFATVLLLCVSAPAAAGVSNDLDVGWISRHPEIATRFRDCSVVPTFFPVVQNLQASVGVQLQ